MRATGPRQKHQGLKPNSIKWAASAARLKPCSCYKAPVEAFFSKPVTQNLRSRAGAGFYCAAAASAGVFCMTPRIFR